MGTVYSIVGKGAAYKISIPVKCWLMSWQLHSQFCFLLMTWEKQWKNGSNAWAPATHVETWIKLLALAWFNPGCCDYLRDEPAVGNLLLYSVTQPFNTHDVVINFSKFSINPLLVSTLICIPFCLADQMFLIAFLFHSEQ